MAERHPAQPRAAARPVKKVILAGRMLSGVDSKAGMFGRQDVKVFFAATGNDTLALHQREKANLIVIALDVSSPGAEELCERIRGSELKAVSILVVGNATSEDRARFSNCNANRYIERPFSDAFFNNILQEKVAELVDVAPRSSYRAPVHSRISGVVRSENFEAFSVNLSKTGMLIRTRRVLEAGDIVDCSFVLGIEGLVSVRAEVMRHAGDDGDDGLYGIKFTRIGLQEMEMLDRFISYHSKLSQS